MPGIGRELGLPPWRLAIPAPRGGVLGDAGAVSLALSAHLSSPGGDPDQYEEEQSGKHIAGVYIFEAGPAGWTGIEDCLCPR